MAAAAAQHRHRPGLGGGFRVGAGLHVKLHAAADDLRDRHIPHGGNALELAKQGFRQLDSKQRCICELATMRFSVSFHFARNRVSRLSCCSPYHAAAASPSSRAAAS